MLSSIRIVRDTAKSTEPALRKKAVHLFLNAEDT